MVAENIKPLLDAGVAGINIEDGHDSADLLAKKIAAIRKVAEGQGVGLYINARTDVYLAGLVNPAEMVSECIKREKQYAEAGASGIFVPVVTNGEEIAQIAEHTTLPLNILAMPGLPKADHLANLGVKRLSAGTGVSKTIWATVAKTAKAFLTHGDFNAFNIEATPANDLQTMFSSDK